MIYQFKDDETRWINFENPKGERGRGGMENNGAKGHAFEKLLAGEEKVLCDFSGCDVIRRIWMTLSDRSAYILQNVYISMYWDHAENPQVHVPIGDFFCMGLGIMRPFENRFFSTAEGRSFLCMIPMPFLENAKIVICNNSDRDINNLFYDINLTLESLPDDTMHFHTQYRDLPENALEHDVEILNCFGGTGRLLGINIAVLPNDEVYHGLWWGEGEVKIFIDGDQDFATLVGTGAEDYVGSAWELGEFVNLDQGCITKIGNAVSMYRFHVNDPVWFHNNIRVTLQAMGGGSDLTVKSFSEENAPYTLVSCDDGVFRGIFGADIPLDEVHGYTNFFCQDHYRTVAYYYQLQKNTYRKKG